MVRSTRILAAVLSLACLPLFDTPLLAQAKKGGEVFPGTVLSMEKEKSGRNYKLKMKAEADDAEIEVPLKPTTRLAVIVKGDDTFLRPGLMVLTEAVVGTSPNQYTGREFTVFVGPNPPGAAAIPDPKAKGVVNICGKLISKEADGLTLQFGPQPSKVLFEGAPTVNVKINDPTLVKEGDTVHVEGIMAKSKKTINAMAVNVTSSETLNADEYFTALEERTGKKGKKASPKSKADKAAEAEAKKAETEAKKDEEKDGAKKKDADTKADDKKE